MAYGDLTTLQNAKAWLGLDPGTASDDVLLARLIISASRLFVEQTNRRVVARQYTEVLDGDDPRIKVRPSIGFWPSGTSFGGSDGIGAIGSRGWAIELENLPVIDVTQVMVDGVVIPAMPVLAAGDPNNNLGASGYQMIDSRRVELVGYRFSMGVGNVSITYDSGYVATGEQALVPSVAPYTVQTATMFLADRGVTNTATGVALTKVGSNPATTQYAVSAQGLYTFAAADTGLGVSLSYSHVPADIEQAVIEIVGLNYRSRDRIGQNSKTVGSETINFFGGPIPMSAQLVIDNHRREQL